MGVVLDVLEGGTTSFEVVLTRGTLVLGPHSTIVGPDFNSLLSHSQQRELINETKSYRETKANIVVILVNIFKTIGTHQTRHFVDTD